MSEDIQFATATTRDGRTIYLMGQRVLDDNGKESLSYVEVTKGFYAVEMKRAHKEVTV